MQRHYPQPVVIGSGLTGLLISIALSKANIEHILIGGPPPSGSPRLGESLNLEATLYFLAEFPELADCYYGKEFAYIYGMDRTGIFDFSFLQDIQTRSFLSLMGKQAPPGLIHFDRVILDAAVYEKAVCSPYCTQLETRVTQINWSANANSIQQIVLQDGDVLPVSHVFDATGYVRLVARQLGIQRQMLGKTQHVVYAHYFRSASPHPTRAWTLPGATAQISCVSMRGYTASTHWPGVSPWVTRFLLASRPRMAPRCRPMR